MKPINHIKWPPNSQHKQARSQQSIKMNHKLIYLRTVLSHDIILLIGSQLTHNFERIFFVALLKEIAYGLHAHFIKWFVANKISVATHPSVVAWFVGACGISHSVDLPPLRMVDRIRLGTLINHSEVEKTLLLFKQQNARLW